MARKPLSFYVAGRKHLLALFLAVALSGISFSQNPIVTENALAGNPKSEWDLSDAGDLSIQGFATDISVNKGQTVQFKIDAGSGTAYTIRIYRLGYYQGNGARLVANLGSFTGTSQPSPTTNTSLGLVDCGNWSVSASWAVPSTAVSGLYLAKLTKTSNGGSSHITFIVRDDASTSAMLFKTSDATWQAYNPYGGGSLYIGPTSYPNGHAVKVSYNRPFITRNGGGGGGFGEDWFMNAEYPMIRFLERNGYDITYTTDVDMDRTTINYTPAKHKVIMSVGHDEYWSLNERNKFEAARGAGVHLAFFSGNEVYWKTRWENSNRTLVCYKDGTLGENVCGTKCDPTSAWTGLWRDGGAYDAGKPENALTGQISWELVTTSIQVPAAYKNLRFWRNTSVANLGTNGTATFPNGTLGYEADFEQYPTHYPSGRIKLSSTNINGKTHQLSLYRHPSGALVFGAGSVQWSWGLDNIHDRGSAAPSTDMQQATVNLFADMGVQPATLMSGLVAATASTDVTAPACVITSPVHGATLSSGSAVTVSGTASDAGGVLVGVEVSVDGGATWQAATGTTSWSYSWTPSTSGTVNIRVRGFDDSGNMSVPGAEGSSSNINVTIGSGGTPTCPCTIFTTSNTPATPNDFDGQPIEVGVKFRSTQSGYITGIRFYKGTSNTGTHTGHLWSSTGTQLASAVFINETASGWQEVLFSTPVAINANTTYVASYHSSSGYYASTSNYFTSAVVNGYLRALANGEDGVNGVYLLTATGAFPTNSFQSSNYWVDVVFQTSVAPDNTPPAVSITSPVTGNVSGTINITANASDNIGVAGVQFLLNGVNLGAEVTVSPYTLSWNTTTVVNGSYTLTARARDAAGNTTTSTGVVVTVNNVQDTQAPAVNITAPVAGATVAGSVSVTANATDNVGVAGVQFLLDGVNLGAEVTTAPYSITWSTTSTTNGSHSLTARARDAAGNTTTSAPVSVTVFNNNLVAAYSFNETTGTTAADISGNNNTGTLTNGPAWSATGKYGGAILLDGTDDFVNVNDANSLDLTNGMTMEAWVNPSNLTGFKTVICKDRTASSYTYTLAANNNTTNTNNQRPNSRARIGNTNRTVTGTSKLPLNTWTHIASTYDGATFRLYVNGVQVSSLATTGNLTVTTDPLRIGGTTALAGQYFAGLIDEVRIYNRALTQAEIQSDMNTPVAPDVIVPTVSITAPAAGTVTGTVSVTATATDNIGVAGVQFLLNGANLGAEDVAAPYTYSWNTTTVTNGTYTLTARARDAAGNVTTSSGVVVTVNNDTQVPVVNITAPAAGTILGTVNVTADASDNIGVVGVQFLVDGNAIGAEDLVAPYSISWNTTTIADGIHTLTARARDAAGNISTSAGVVVTVQNNPPDTEFPAVNITAPAAGEVSGTINVTANATDNVAVVGVQFLLNGANMGTEDLASPYLVSWNTTTVTNGTYTITARARDAAGNVTTSAGVVVTVNNIPDTGSPTVSITAPAAGTVTGTVNVNANATDNVGVLGVQFLLNGANLGTEDVSAPYSISWNTLTAVNGTYTLTARARDAAGNITTSAGVTVTVNNNTNLIAAFPMNEGSGTIAADISGNSHNGTLTNGPTWGTGRYGQGINLNGSSDYINIADHTNFTLDPTQSYTWSGWIRNNNFNEWSTVWSQTVDAGSFFYFYAHTSTDPDGGPVTNGISVYWWANGGSNKLGAHSNDNVLTAGQWSHVAITYNGTVAQASRFTIYVNGVNVTATADISSTGTLPTINPANIRIGSNQPFGEYLNGSVDEFRFYNRLLSGAEIVNDMNTPLAPDNIAPVVSITAPAAGTVTGTVSVTATATDNIGVAGVQFLLNGANLGAEDVVAPFNVPWNTTTAANGTYTLTARARDGAGNVTTSSGVVVTVNNDTQAPAVSITAPAAGTILGTVNVTADASDNVGVVGVQFLVDGNAVGAEDPVAPYSISWNTTTIADGIHTLTARARDAAGNTTTSAGIVVTVQNNPPDTEFPVVNITAPATGEVSGTISVTANATDNVGVIGVQFLLNGANLGSEDLATPYSVSWNTTTAANGIYTLTARARDAAGNVTTSAGAVVTVNNIPDTQAPTVSITAPAAGTVTGTINVNANAADNVGVVGVQFLLNGTNIGTEDVSSPYSISWNTLTSVNGTYTLTALARDAAGNTTTSTGVVVTVNNNTNLIAALNFNEGTGTLATDISGKNHPGTLVNGPTWGAGKYDQGVNLDGTNDYVNIADHADFTLDPAQSYTWSGWVKNNNFNEWSTVWSQTADANNFFYFYAHTSSDPDGGPVTNGVSVYWWANGGSNKLGAHSNNNVLTAGVWSYVAITYNAALAQANRFTIYVNGVNVTATSDVSSTGTLPAINPANIRIGSNQPFGEYLNGSIDEFRFYTRLLTATEIQTDMNSALSNMIVPVVTPASGATGVATNTTVTTVFNLTMDAATINSSTIELRNALNVLVPSTVTYNSTTRTATLTPSAALANSVVYTVIIKGGASGVKDAGGGTMTSDYTGSFTTAEPPLIAMTEGPGGPVLAISSSSNPFSRYTLEILRAEGLNHFAAADISAVTATVLNNYDVVILGEMTVTAAQATMFTNWVNAGGTLIAFKPSAELNTLMGISASSGTLSDKYLLVNTSSGPGVGIVNQTIQFHGAANLHTLSGATSLATLYSNATTATVNPAVTLRNVGTNGGVAVAFTYDLPKSIIYTRQGNPAWAGQKRDGTTGPIRPDDLYFGQPAGTGVDWVDFNKIVIPQADEQQRFLANIILQSNLAKKPLPRFWYLPNGIKAAVIYALDDHGTSTGTSTIFSKMTTNSTVGCLVNNWECFRATSWFYQGIPLTNTQAVTYNSQGFEMGVHVQNNCTNFTSFANLDGNYSTQLQNFQSAYPGLPAQTTHRFHCLAWSDWATQAKVELSRGIRLSLDYYYWPSSWVSGRPGLFTGSGMPMRFADTDGTMLDIYQGVTQLVNENGVNYTLGANTLLDNALGAQGYYGIFGTHDDFTDATFSDAIIASAKARNVPIITARQALTWLDSRSNSYFTDIVWSNNQLSFTIVARSNAYNLMTMLPFNSAGGQLLSVTMDGSPVTFTTQTIKGIQYAFFTAATGIHNYIAVYSAPGLRVTTATQSTTATDEVKTGETTDHSALGDKLYVNVLPNPSKGQFSVVITSNDATPVTVTVMNMFGQVVEQKQKLASTGILRIGESWTSGTYFAEVMQGDKKKVVRLVKLN